MKVSILTLCFIIPLLAPFLVSAVGSECSFSSTVFSASFPDLDSSVGSQFELVKRHACSVASDCSRTLPAFSQHVCTKGLCHTCNSLFRLLICCEGKVLILPHIACNPGYHFKHSKCVKSKHQAVAHHQHHHHHHGGHHKTPPTIPAPNPVTAPKPKPKPTSSGSAPKTPPAVAPPSSLLSSAGVKSFLGVNTGIVRLRSLTGLNTRLNPFVACLAPG